MWKMLREHSQVYLPPCKDIYYFDRYYTRGIEWYETHFKGANQAIAVGEFSHDYLMSDEACRRIKADLPDIKLIAMVRDPADRAFSEYLYLRKHCLIDSGTTLRDATRSFPSIIESGMYGRHLGEYLREFGEKRVFVGDYEDIALKPSDLITRICTFLGVDPVIQFGGLREVVLPAAAARNPWIAKQAKGLAMQLRDMGFGTFVGALKHSKVVHGVLFKEYRALDRPRLSPDDRRWLQDLYNQDIKELEALLGRSFGRWIQCASDT